MELVRLTSLKVSQDLGTWNYTLELKSSYIFYQLIWNRNRGQT